MQGSKGRGMKDSSGIFLEVQLTDENIKEPGSGQNLREVSDGQGLLSRLLLYCFSHHISYRYLHSVEWEL